MNVLEKEEAKMDQYKEELPSLTEILEEGIYCKTFITRGDFEDITHIKVFRQQKGAMSMLCGFHCYKNLELMVRALTTDKKEERLKHLVNLSSASYFFQSYERTLRFIEKSDN